MERNKRANISTLTSKKLSFQFMASKELKFLAWNSFVAAAGPSGVFCHDHASDGCKTTVHAAEDCSVWLTTKKEGHLACVRQPQLQGNPQGGAQGCEASIVQSPKPYQR